MIDDVERMERLDQIFKPRQQEIRYGRAIDTTELVSRTYPGMKLVRTGGWFGLLDPAIQNGMLTSTGKVT